MSLLQPAIKSVVTVGTVDRHVITITFRTLTYLRRIHHHRPPLPPPLRLLPRQFLPALKTWLQIRRMLVGQLLER